jgi:glutathione S-transferase
VPQFVIHSVPGSPYGRAVLAALEEKSSRYRFAPVQGDNMGAGN